MKIFRPTSAFLNVATPGLVLLALALGWLLFLELHGTYP